MSDISPTLLRLFGRSRYVTHHRPPDEDEDEVSDETKWIRQDRERWIVAALGHVLTHDEKFRNKFWATMCSQDDKEVPDRIEVAVEPESSADLCLTASGKSGTIVCVIEAKAGAELANHQNPENEAFLSDRNKPKGYGNCLISRHGKTASQLRYVVLGYRGEPLQLPKNPLDTQPPIQVFQHPWSTVANIAPQSDLVRDLFGLKVTLCG